MQIPLEKVQLNTEDSFIFQYMMVCVCVCFNKLDLIKIYKLLFERHY